MKQEKLMIFGAQSFARGIYMALKTLYPSCPVEGFLVSSLNGNPENIDGVPVLETDIFAAALSDAEKDNVKILIATPEDLFEDIMSKLTGLGFGNYICMDSHKDAALMKEYYDAIGLFPALCELPKGNKSKVPEVYQVKFYKDKPLKNAVAMPDWCIPLQVGAALTAERVAELTDDTGDNISAKNPNYCELTAWYWMWKNRLKECADETYFGMFHYRRILDIAEEDLFRLAENDVDVILPYPTIHYPDIKEHHKRYVKEADWQAMLQALKEVQPEYVKAYEEIFGQQYFYNYNIVIAKKSILEDYCEWMFSILERTEELSEPKGWQRGDRYIGYIGESLTTLYFMHHQKDYKIVHAGRYMLT